MVPSIDTLSTVKAVNVPTDVIFVCAAVVTVPAVVAEEALVALVAVSAFPVNAPTKEVDVIEVAPVTTPASTLIVPSKTIAEPPVGVY